MLDGFMKKGMCCVGFEAVCSMARCWVSKIGGTVPNLGFSLHEHRLSFRSCFCLRGDFVV
jgi:hypothetical protein